MPSTARSSRSRSAPRPFPFRRSRFWGVCALFVLWAIVIVSRLFWLQIMRHDEYLERAIREHQRVLDVAPRRGILYDRNRRELAMTVKVDSIYAVPGEVENKPAAARALAASVNAGEGEMVVTEEQIATRLASSKSFVWIARRVSDKASARVRELSLKGVYFQKEFQRFYPDNEMAAQVLGYVGLDNSGLGGIEQKFETQLHGAPGRVYSAVDAHHHALGSSEHEPEAGQNLMLTLDENIQFMAEHALDHAMQRTQSATGTVIVQDVHSGQILALAVRPAFNPNLFRHILPGQLWDHAVSGAYEPGSTFKLVTYSAALEQGVATPADIVDCQGGQIKIGGRIIHDDKSDGHLGKITVAQALQKSSDVAAVKMALKVGPERFYQYIRDFGFGARTGAELPAEARGLLRPVAKWSASSIGTIAIGQEIAVTPVQLVSMVSTIANGGVYLPPHIVMPGQVDAAAPNLKAAELPASPFKPGAELPNPLPPGAHRVLSTMTAAQMRKMMEGVVLYGTGKEAQLNGYSSGGKTGTAQKYDYALKAYLKNDHVGSFAGIAPANNPVIAVAVVMNSPKGEYYGATVAAPVFAEVAQQVLEYLGVPHDTTLRTTRATAKARQRLTEDEGSSEARDIQALAAAANDLPSDDPLRAVQQQAPVQPALPVAAAAPPAKPLAPSPGPPPVQTRRSTPTEIAVADKRLHVPSFVGLPMRKVIELASAAGLEIQIVGNGTVREQSPAAGTMVEPGSTVVVHCGH